MPPTVTPAVVLHAFDYMESSRIVRLFTRDAGVLSVLARGARVSKRRFGGGAALDLFTEGEATFQAKVGRELHTLTGFDVVRVRTALGLDIARFTAASALAELILRFAGDDAQPDLYDVFVGSLDALAVSPLRGGYARGAGIAAAWRLVAELGFAPTLEQCGRCHAQLADDEPAGFSHPAGGVVCPACARLGGVSRVLPAEARLALRGWLQSPVADSAQTEPLDDRPARAHQRLLREFLREHLADGRPLLAFEVWEGERWDDKGAGAARVAADDAAPSG